jgi:hypothetical protein
MVMLVRLVHLPKAISPIDVTLAGMLTLVRLVHLRNALSPIEVTPEGMVMLVRLQQSKNALSPIEVTPLGMVTWLAFPLYFTSVVPSISKPWPKSETAGEIQMSNRTASNNEQTFFINAPCSHYGIIHYGKLMGEKSNLYVILYK